MADDVELVGLDVAMRDLRRWADGVAPYVDQRTRDLGVSVAGDVRGRVPVVSGALASSVTVVDVEGGGWAVGMGDDEDVRYAGWVEFGGARGRPYIPEGRYLTPTATAAEHEFEMRATDAVDESIARYPWTQTKP